MQLSLSRFLFYGDTVPGTLLDRMVSMGESPTERYFNSQFMSRTIVPITDGHVDTSKHLLLIVNLPSCFHIKPFEVIYATTAL